MKKKFLRFCIMSALFFNTTSCFFNNNFALNTGSIKMSVKFPVNNKFSVKFIPENTYIIIVQVSGTGINSSVPLSFSLTKTESTRLINNVPQGNKTVKVTALSQSADLLAEGESTVNIISQTLNKVEVELKQVKNNTTSFPTQTPSPSIEPSVNPTPFDCTINLEANNELKPYLEQQLIDAGCKIVTPSSTPTPTPLVTPTATSSTYYYSSSGGGGIPVTTDNPIPNPTPTATPSIIPSPTPTPYNSVGTDVYIENGNQSSNSTLTAQ